MEGFDGNTISHYPVFRNPKHDIPPGTSLCRLGYPFSRITGTFDESINQFRIADGVIPMPRFPNDGIHTRTMIKIDETSGRQAQFLETSSAGLLGQSGGPIFDINGYICALQSATVHLPLGFSPVIKQGNKEITEHQFMHVGVGAHVIEIVRFLEENAIQHTLSD